MITAEIVRTLDGVDAIQGEWERLFCSLGQQPSLSFEWSRAILNHHLRDKRDWFVVVLKRGQETVGIVPMMSVADRVLGLRLVSLQPVQQLYATHGGLLLDALDGEAVVAWLRAAVSAVPRWDLLRLSRLLEHEPLLDSLMTLGPDVAVRVYSKAEQPAFHLKLPASLPEYMAARTGKFRNYLRRATKKSEARGQIAFTRLIEEKDFPAQFDELMAIERNSWKHSCGTAISSVAHQAGFYEEVARGALSNSRLHLTFLRVEGEAVAYNLGIVWKGCYYYLKTSYAESLRSFGVATIGRAKLIEQLIAEGVRELDFPGELYEWERQWTTDLRPHRSLLVFNRSVLGSVAWMGIVMLNLLRGRARDTKLVFHDPRALRH